MAFFFLRTTLLRQSITSRRLLVSFLQLTARVTINQLKTDYQPTPDKKDYQDIKNNQERNILPKFPKDNIFIDCVIYNVALLRQSERTITLMCAGVCVL